MSPADVVDLLSRARDWMKKGTAAPRDEALALIADCAAAEPELPQGADWEQLLKASLIRRLAELVEAVQDARELAANIARPDRPLPDALMTRLFGISRRKLHRDWGLALLSGFAATVTTMACCAIWIALQWPEGAIMPTFAAILMSLFATLDDPSPAISAFMKASILSLPLAAFSYVRGVAGDRRLSDSGGYIGAGLHRSGGAPGQSKNLSAGVGADPEHCRRP